MARFVIGSVVVLGVFASAYDTDMQEPVYRHERSRRALHWNLDESLERSGFHADEEHLLHPGAYHGHLRRDPQYEDLLSNDIFSNALCFSDEDCEAHTTCEVIDTVHRKSECVSAHWLND